MAAFFRDDNFKCNFFNEDYRIPIRLSLKFVPRSAIYNKPALVQVMVWRRIGDKLLPEPMLNQFSDAYMWHQSEMNYQAISSIDRDWNIKPSHVIMVIFGVHSASLWDVFLGAY